MAVATRLICPSAELSDGGPGVRFTVNRHGIEQLVAILPQRPQRAAAVGTGAVTLLGLDPLLLARQMSW